MTLVVATDPCSGRRRDGSGRRGGRRHPRELGAHVVFFLTGIDRVAVDFVAHGGERAVITSLDRMADAIAGRAGTTIVQ